MLASLNGHVEVLDTLLQHGADVDLKSGVSAELFSYYVILLREIISKDVDMSS